MFSHFSYTLLTFSPFIFSPSPWFHLRISLKVILKESAHGKHSLIHSFQLQYPLLNRFHCFSWGGGQWEVNLRLITPPYFSKVDHSGLDLLSCIYKVIGKVTGAKSLTEIIMARTERSQSAKQIVRNMRKARARKQVSHKAARKTPRVSTKAPDQQQKKKKRRFKPGSKY